MKRRWMVLLCAALWLLGSAKAELEPVYTLVDEQGQALTQRAGQMYVDDEYIAENDLWYRVVSVDDGARVATAQLLGEARLDEQAWAAFTGSAAAESKDSQKRIAMYSTHSDESYVPGDGESSKWTNAGIYDVGDSLKEALEERGIETVYSKETFLPHDADAYSRSRRVAEELMKQGPDALLDIHRDAVPAEQYDTEVDGEPISKVRLFVGRTNQNASENKAFAQQIKSAADREYPGLIKDIFIGKGNYNQDLYPNSLLLEFGSHETDKDRAIESTGYMAEILDGVLYSGSARAEGAKAERTGAAVKGTGWAIGLALLAAVAYAFIATGSGEGAWQKLKHRASELSGGLFGDRNRR